MPHHPYLVADCSCKQTDGVYVLMPGIQTVTKRNLMQRTLSRLADRVPVPDPCELSDQLHDWRSLYYSSRVPCRRQTPMKWSLYPTGYPDKQILVLLFLLQLQLQLHLVVVPPPPPRPPPPAPHATPPKLYYHIYMDLMYTCRSISTFCVYSLNSYNINIIHSIEVRVQNMQYTYLIFRSMVIDAPSIFTKLYEIINVEIYTYKSGDTERTLHTYSRQ